MTLDIHREVALDESGGRRLRGSRAAENGAQPGHELSRAERLGHVVVGPDRQPDQLVHLLDLGREHQDRDVGGPPDLPAEGHPVDLGQHQIQDDEPWAVALEQVQRLRAVVGREHPEPLPLEIHPDELDELVVVVHHQDGCLLGHSPGLPANLPAAAPAAYKHHIKI